MSILSPCHIICTSLQSLLMGQITLTCGTVMTQHIILDAEWDNTLQNLADLGQNIIRKKKQKYVYKNKNTTKQVKSTKSGYTRGI